MIPEVDEHRPVTRLTGTVVTSHRYPRPVRSFVDNAGDTIQSKHLRGKFYEEDEFLKLLQRAAAKLRQDDTMGA